jgi:hypothetical protein
MKMSDQLHVSTDLLSIKEHPTLIEEDPRRCQNPYVHGKGKGKIIPVLK